MRKPILEPEFKPAIVEMRKFAQDVQKDKHITLGVAIKRNGGYVYRRDLEVFADGIDDERNIFIVERYVKTLLWVVGGYEIHLSGSKKIYEQMAAYYSKGGLRDFDFNFMSGVYETEFKVIYHESLDDMPKEKSASVPTGGYLKGKRVGFDAGGSDRKVSAIIDGETVYSEETVWFPKLESDPQYHFDGIYQSMRTAIDKMGGDCDAIGVSSAGVYIDNKAMVASLFVKVPAELKEKRTKTIYIDVIHQLEKELGHEIPFVVANDGDVTALAGAMDLKDNAVLGIAMGTSEAVGYVDPNGNLNGWLSELAFAPVDFNKEAMSDEWSLDWGVGCKYFSQDAVIKLAPRAGIELDPNLSLAEKLKVVQKLMAEGNEGAQKIYETIGTYLGYTLAYYAEFYQIRHVLILGRVTSGKGGDIILDVAKKTLSEEFPEYASMDIGMPSEYMRRVGQSIAAGSLAKSKLD